MYSANITRIILNMHTFKKNCIIPQKNLTIQLCIIYNKQYKEKFMAFNSNGQISYLVLDSLSDGSKYGLEIIEYITKKTNGGFLMKKPTLYSCLTRMEKKGLVSSSYWGESELGGKRHYYSITDLGRETLKELEATFKDVAVSSSIFEAEVETSSPEMVEEKQEEKSENITFLEQSNFFDLVKPVENKTVSDDEDDEDTPLANQINFFDIPVEEETEDITTERIVDKEIDKEQEITAEISKVEEEKIEYYQSILENTQSAPVKDDAVFLDESERVELSKDQEEQNKRIFDSSSELKKYRKKKSFSENQIEMSVVYDSEEDNELQKAKIAALKQSLLNMKNGNVEEIEPKTEEPAYAEPTCVEPAIQPETYQYQNTTDTEKEEVEEKDDGVFITERMSASSVPIQRKIAPPNIDIFKDKLPAPKRNSDLEPTYSDMMSKIMERKKEKEIETHTPPVQDTKFQSMNNYSDLKKYYNSQGIDFKEYQKSPVNKSHNTNLLKFICSIIMFVLSAVASAILYVVLNSTENIVYSTSFMFYTLPACFLCYCIYAFISYKTTESKKPALLYTASVNWIVFTLASMVVIVVNILCGMQVENILQYLTSLLLPTISFAIIFPINHHIKKFVYERYSK